MEGIDKENILEKLKVFASKYLMYVLIAIIVIILIILIIPNRTIKEEAIRKAKKYIKSNNISLTNVEQELSFSKIGMELEESCYEGGLVLASTNGYKVYYVCNNAPSEDLQALLRSNQFTLNGTNPFYVSYGNSYLEPGYYVKDDDTIVKESGMVVGAVGMYLLKYEAIGNGKYMKSNRVVLVTRKSFASFPTLKLKGDSRIILIKGETYNEPGYEAYDSKDGTITSRVRIEGYVDTSRVGKYTLKYIISNNSGRTTEVNRYISVVNNTAGADFEITATPSTLTNGDVNLNILVTGDGYDFILDPDGNVSTLTDINYKVTTNGTYEFSLKKKDGSIIEKSIEVKNIDKKKPTGSCKSVVTNSKTVVTVTANDESGIQKYGYTVGSYHGESTSNTYTANSAIKTATVTVYDKAANYQLISCVIDDKTTPIISTPVITPTEPTPPSTPTTPVTPSTHYQTSKYGSMNYIIYYPDNLNLNNKNPLVIFLHGDGETGTSVSNLSGLVFVKNMKSGKFQNAVYLVPQRSGGSYWDSYIPTVKSLIDQVVSSYNIDTRKISITGHSSGGIGVYTMVSRYPNFFSAAVVLSGRKKESGTSGLLSTPIRHYHGTNDSSVAYSKGQTSAAEIKNAGGTIEFIPLQGKYHAITSDVYNNTDAIEWMIRQSR